ncbi:MAG: hypothetical protein CM15mP78_04660 [Candidatus Poseidoniales archaeon]|nr:MAG: hypothetical protein CM15mP78_04660 [Candidatus Poseidoniales archaeon]
MTALHGTNAMIQWPLQKPVRTSVYLVPLTGGVRIGLCAVPERQVERVAQALAHAVGASRWRLSPGEFSDYGFRLHFVWRFDERGRTGADGDDRRFVRCGFLVGMSLGRRTGLSPEAIANWQPDGQTLPEAGRFMFRVDVNAGRPRAHLGVVRSLRAVQVNEALVPLRLPAHLAALSCGTKGNKRATRLLIQR